MDLKAGDQEGFLMVEDDRMEDVTILSEPSTDTDEQDLLAPDKSPQFGTLELHSTSEIIKPEYQSRDISRDVPRDVSRDIPHEFPRVEVEPRSLAEENSLQRSPSNSSVDIACQTDETKSYTDMVVENVVQGTYAGGKCLVDGCANLLKTLNIGTAPGNFTGTLKEDIAHVSSHLSGVLFGIGRELSLERIKYKLFL